ncbi:hypothetical protein F5146DRAFT_1014028 [Armillaria mellea]|nr:hypothetical protein F5146DRAFT_1014028 [Armillaria mellea]
MASLLPYEPSPRDSPFNRSVEPETDGLDGQDVVPSPEHEDLHHVIERLVDAVIQLRTLYKCAERRRQSQKLALSMGIDVENNIEDSFPELEQINAIEKVANDNMVIDIALLGALHEPSVLAKMSEHTDNLHRWIEMNGSHVGYVVDTLMKHYKSLKNSPNSILKRIEDLLFEASAIRTKLEERFQREKLSQQSSGLLQKRAVAMMRSALEPLLMDFRVREESMFQERTESVCQDLWQLMVPLNGTSAMGDGDNTGGHVDEDNGN